MGLVRRLVLWLRIGGSVACERPFGCLAVVLGGVVVRLGRRGRSRPQLSGGRLSKVFSFEVIQGFARTPAPLAIERWP